jgi:hypothetical protein
MLHILEMKVDGSDSEDINPEELRLFLSLEL